MTDSDRSCVVDGFSVLKAIRLGAEERGMPPRSGDNHVMRTVLPSRHEVVCYRCGHVFDLLGRLSMTHCPKCQITLRKTDYKIDGSWEENVETIGNVHITPTGMLSGGCQIVGGDIVLEGVAEDGRIRACRTLLLAPGARFDFASVEARDFHVASGAILACPDGTLRCRNMVIEGELGAQLHAEGTVVVRAGGFLKGEIHAERLVVEEGGGLIGKVFVDVVSG